MRQPTAITCTAISCQRYRIPGATLSHPSRVIVVSWRIGIFFLSLRTEEKCDKSGCLEAEGCSLAPRQKASRAGSSRATCLFFFDCETDFTIAAGGNVFKNFGFSGYTYMYKGQVSKSDLGITGYPTRPRMSNTKTNPEFQIQFSIPSLSQ